MQASDVGALLALLIWIAIVLLLARIVLEWVQTLAPQWSPRGLIAVICEGIYSATDPPLRAVRRVVPPVRLGAVALDLSALIVMFGLWILLNLVGIIF